MPRLSSVALFSACHIASAVLVCYLNTAYIVRDAVIGTMTAAALYAVLLGPAFLVGAVVLLTMPLTELSRLTLAVTFGVFVGAVLEAVLLSAQLGWHEVESNQSAVPILVVMNVVLALIYVLLGLLGKQRELRSAPAA